MTYKIALQHSDEGYAVWCPSLPGCCSQGATEAEALDNIRDAIQEYLAARDEQIENDFGESEVREVEIPDYACPRS